MTDKLPERLVQLNDKFIEIVRKFVADNQVSEVELYPILKSASSIAYSAMLDYVFKPKPQVSFLLPERSPQICNALTKPQGTTIDHICKLPWKHEGGHMCAECRKSFAIIEQEAKAKLQSYKDWCKAKQLALPQPKGDKYADAEQLAKIYALPHSDVQNICDNRKKSDPSWLTKAEAEQLLKDMKV